MTGPLQLPRDTHSDGGQPFPADPVTLRGAAGADGSCTITSNAVAAVEQWLIDYLTTTVSSAASLTVYLGDPADGVVFDGTTAAQSAVAAYVPARIVPQGQHLTAVWTGATPGAACRLRIEYRRQRVVS